MEFLEQFPSGIFSQTVNIFLQTYKMVFSCWYVSGFVPGSVDDTTKLVFYQGPPCVTPRKTSGCCFASESHSHCSSIKHLLQPPPIAAALSFCIHTRAFHFKAKSQPALWKDISRKFRFNNVARRKTSNQLKGWSHPQEFGAKH